MSRQLIVVEDVQDFGLALRTRLEGSSPIEVVLVDSESPCLDALRLLDERKGDWPFLLVDVKMPDLHGVESTEAGFLFTEVVLEKYPEMRGRIAICSGHEVERNARRAEEMGVPFYDKLKMADNLGALRDQVIAQAARLLVPEGLGLVARPITAREARQEKEYDAFLNDPHNLDRYGGKVVVLHEGSVLGSGPDHLDALADAKRATAEQGQPLPRPPELVFVVVPEQADGGGELG